MRVRSLAIRVLVSNVAVFAILIALSGVGHASTIIGTGYELLVQLPGGLSVDLLAVPNPQTIVFEGLPIGSFDFGSGPVSTTSTDTIFRRLAPADLSGGFDTIDIEIVALSLVSTTLVDLGFGAGFESVFLTLNTSSPSFQSTMTIFDTGEGSPHGTFDQTLNLSADLVGSVGGFYATIEDTTSFVGIPWKHEHSSSLQIEGVNHNLDGGSPHSHSQDFERLVALVPEPNTALLIALGLAGLGWRGRVKQF